MGLTLCFVAGFSPVVCAQTPQAPQGPQQAVNAGASVPQLIQFSGVLKDAYGKPLSGIQGVTFAIYQDQEGGAALWMETQNVTPDAAGHYTVFLGAASNGVPNYLFASGQAKWLGVRSSGRPEMPRTLLVSVPYALKAGDANTLGGMPPSAFLLANSLAAVAGSANTSGASPTSTGAAVASATVSNVTTTGGTLNFLPLWTGSTTLLNSALFQSGTSIGIGNKAPAATLDVTGSGIFRGFLQLPPTGTANPTTKGFNSQPFDFLASVFNGTAAVNQHFRWQTELVNPGLTTASGKLNLLFASGTGVPAETGFSFSNKGLITFASGQTFPGAGTITGVTTAVGTGLQGGGTSGALTLSLIKTCANGQTLTWSTSTLKWGCSSAGTGTITGVTTAAGTGLQGGVTTGTASLSLLKTCAAKQVLQWSGTAWACATASGTGTITGVTAGTDLTGGGTTGTVTLNLNTTKVPQLAAANTFTTAQSITGNNTTQLLNVTQSGTGGAITGSAPSGPGLAGSGFEGILAKSSFPAGIAGLFQNTGGGQLLRGLSSTGTQVFSVDNSGNLTANSVNISTSSTAPFSATDTSTTGIAVFGIASNGSGNAIGVEGDTHSGSGFGLEGKNFFNGVAVLGSAGNGGIGVEGNGVIGVKGLSEFTLSGPGVQGISTGADAPGVDGISSSASGVGGEFQNTGGGQILRGLNSASTTVFTVDGAGNVSGTSGTFTTPAANGTALTVSETDPTTNDTPVGISGNTLLNTGVGILGHSGPLSGTGTFFFNNGFGTGVFADASRVHGVGLYATADDGFAEIVENNTGIDRSRSALFVQNNSTTTGALVFQTDSGLNGGCTIDVSGNLLCTGSKSAVVPVNSGQKMVALYAVEAPQNWFEDFGSGQLASGAATVQLGPTYAQTVNTTMEYHVFLTPKGDCRGLYVTNETPTSFEVRELQGGHSSIAFDYRIVAKRKGYEQIRLADKTAMMKGIAAQASKLQKKHAGGPANPGVNPQ